VNGIRLFSANTPVASFPSHRRPFLRIANLSCAAPTFPARRGRRHEIVIFGV